MMDVQIEEEPESKFVPAAAARSRLDRTARAVLLLMLMGAALRIGWLLSAHPAPVSDFLGYRSLAYRWLTTGQFARSGVPTAYRTPGYPAFLALGMIASKATWWLSLTNVALSTAAIPLTALFATRLGFGRGTVIGSAALVAVVPTFVFFAPVLASEHLQLVLALGAWCLSLRTTSPRRAVIGGLVYGVAIIVRPESLFYLFAAPWLIRVAVPNWRRIACFAAVTALTAAVVVAPWYVRNELAVGRGAGLSTTGGLNLYLAHRSEPGSRFVPLDQTPLRGLDELETNRKGMTLGLRNIRSDPLGLVATTWNHTYEQFRSPTYAPYYSTRKLVAGRYAPTVSEPVVSAATLAAKVSWYAIAALLAIGLVTILADRPMRRPRDAARRARSSRTGSASPSCSGACRATATRSSLS